MSLPDINAVIHAAGVIEPHIHHTPVIHSRSINAELGCEVFFKCENFQRTGSFKMRGASNAVATIQQTPGKAGVITHSSGNHAAALACAAQQFNLPCEVVMPRDASDFKQQAVLRYGANLTLCEPGMVSRESTTTDMMAERPDLQLVHPYDDARVIAGQGTATLQFLQQVEDLQALLLPVGGGGLISGASIVIRASQPDIELVGVEPQVVAEAKQSLVDGHRHPATGGKTIADGLQAGIGELNFTIIQQGVSDILSVSEQQIRHALRMIIERLKVVAEPSAAVTLAALMASKQRFSGRRVGVILSGGNIDPDRIHDLI